MNLPPACSDDEDIRLLVTRSVNDLVLDTVPGPRERVCVACRAIVHTIIDDDGAPWRDAKYNDAVIAVSALRAVEEWRPSWEYIKVFGDDARHRSIETTSNAREMLREAILQRSISPGGWVTRRVGDEAGG
jgi:hypothetical protein